MTRASACTEEKLSELIDTYDKLVFSICYKLTGDYFMAEDLMQETFLSALTVYFEKMAERGALPPADFDALALIFFASTFGYAFLRASFQDTLSAVDTERYIENQTALFLAKLVQT